MVVIAAFLALALSMQAIFALYLTLYAWEHPERLRQTAGPPVFLSPRLSFTVLLPARHEERVIGETIRRIVECNYPEHLLEVAVVCHDNDDATIRQAQREIELLGTTRVRVETFSGGPINKPRGLNVGLASTQHSIVTVFDAEDDIHPDIFHVVNTVMQREHVRVVQAGVQLMNFADRWFSIHNCLEYFFWFKSRLQFHAAVGMIPLGGNTVFMSRELLNEVGGWDESCLTEDAEIGLRISALGERIRVAYDARWVTREETPHSVAGLIRQRTRWHQGFLQVLRKGCWRDLPQRRQRVLAAVTFAQPLLDAALTLAFPLAVVELWLLKLPVPVAMLSFIPLYLVGFQMLATVVGARVFAREFGETMPALLPLRMMLTYLPYQWLLGISAIRAVLREARRVNRWEKTEHQGAHRRPGLAYRTGEVPGAATR